MPGSSGPTSPGGGNATACQLEYERGYNHGYLAGMKTTSSGQAPARTHGYSEESLLSRFLLGIALGFIPALLLGLFMGLFLALSFKT